MENLNDEKRIQNAETTEAKKRNKNDKRNWRMIGGRHRLIIQHKKDSTNNKRPELPCGEPKAVVNIPSLETFKQVLATSTIYI